MKTTKVIISLPDGRKSRIFKDNHTGIYRFGEMGIDDRYNICTNQQLLLVSDMEIMDEYMFYKAGDFVYNELSGVGIVIEVDRETKFIGVKFISEDNEVECDAGDIDKIIASYLPIEGVLPIQDSDVEYMVNNVDCEVEVEIMKKCCTPIGQIPRYIDCNGCGKLIFKPATFNGFIALKFSEKEVEEKKWTDEDMIAFANFINNECWYHTSVNEIWRKSNDSRQKPLTSIELLTEHKNK